MVYWTVSLAEILITSQWENATYSSMAMFIHLFFSQAKVSLFWLIFNEDFSLTFFFFPDLHFCIYSILFYVFAYLTSKCLQNAYFTYWLASLSSPCRWLSSFREGQEQGSWSITCQVWEKSWSVPAPLAWQHSALSSIIEISMALQQTVHIANVRKLMALIQPWYSGRSSQGVWKYM